MASSIRQSISPLQQARTYLEGRFGANVLMDLDGAIENKDCISTGHPFIDWVLGGGIYYGKHHELAGLESSGKSTLAYTVAAECQKKKRNTGRVLILDYENAFDKKYFKALGGQLGEDKLIVSQPETSEEGFEIMRVVTDMALVDLIIVDSVAAMMSSRESGSFDAANTAVGAGKSSQAGGMGEMQVGLHARVMSQGLKQITSRTNRNGVAVLWINQFRTKLNFKGISSNTTTGGNALKYYAAVRLEFVKKTTKVGKLYDPIENKTKDGPVAMQTIVKCTKNKEAPPFREALTTLTFGLGFDADADMLNLAATHGVIKKGATGWYDLNQLGIDKKFRGEFAFLQAMREDPKLREVILSKLDWKALLEKSEMSHVVGDRSDEVDAKIEAILGGAFSGNEEQFED